MIVHKNGTKIVLGKK